MATMQNLGNAKPNPKSRDLQGPGKLTMKAPGYRTQVHTGKFEDRGKQRGFDAAVKEKVSPGIYKTVHKAPPKAVHTVVAQKAKGRAGY